MLRRTLKSMIVRFLTCGKAFRAAKASKAVAYGFKCIKTILTVLFIFSNQLDHVIVIT